MDKKLNEFLNKHRLAIFPAVIVSVTVGLLGIYLLQQSLAASEAVSVEAEPASLGADNKASIINDADASGGRALQFAAAEITEPAPNPSPGTPPPIEDGGRVLWRGGAEAGRDAWSSHLMESPSRITAVSDFQGRDAWRVQVLRGDDVTGARAEFGQDNGGDGYRDQYAFTIGSESWLGYSFYMPDGFETDAPWSTVTQWKDLPDQGSPSFGTYVQGGDIQIDGSIGTNWQTPATTGVWHNFVIHQKISTGGDGIFDIYYSTSNDTPALVHEYRGETSRGSRWLVPRMGYYRHPDISNQTPVYHAHWAVGTSFDAANPVW